MDNEIMTTEQFLIEMIETGEKQDTFLEFYDLADKYGFCTPWCNCGKCV